MDILKLDSPLAQVTGDWGMAYATVECQWYLYFMQYGQSLWESGCDVEGFFKDPLPF